MAYTLIPGVQQDHKGRYYQYGVYPNGKGIQVPCTIDTKVKRVTEWHLPDDYMPETAVNSQFEKKRKTEAVLEWRMQNGSMVRDIGPQELIEATVLSILPLMRFDGRRWLVAISGADWHVQYFKPKE